MSRKIAFFDFDGTITKCDTLLAFIRYTKGYSIYLLGMLLNVHYLIGLKLKLVSSQKAKEKILTFFFKNTPVELFNENCRIFSNMVFTRQMRPKALVEIERLRRAGVQIAIVSASPVNWLKEIGAFLNVPVIGTRLEVHDGKLTGRIAGNNCTGFEKVHRIRQVYNLTEFDEILTYGDSAGDVPMLNLGTHAFYKPFH